MEYNVSVSRSNSHGRQQMKPDGCMGLSMVSPDNPALPNPYRRRATMGFDDSSSDDAINNTSRESTNSLKQSAVSRRVMPSSMDSRCLLHYSSNAPSALPQTKQSPLPRSGSRGNLSAEKMASAVRRVRSGSDLLGRRAAAGPRRSGSRRNMRSTSSPSISKDEENYLESAINSSHNKNYNWSDDVSLDDDSEIVEAEASGALRRVTSHYSKRSGMSRAKSERIVNLGGDASGNTASLALSAVRRSGSKSNLDKLFGGTKESSSSTSREERTIASSTSREERTVGSSTSSSNHSGGSSSKRPSKTKLLGSFEDEKSQTNRSIARSSSKNKLVSRSSSGNSPKSPKRSSSKSKLAEAVQVLYSAPATISPTSPKRSSSKSKVAEMAQEPSTTTTPTSPKRSSSKSKLAAEVEQEPAITTTKEITLIPSPSPAVTHNPPAASSPFVSSSWTCTCGYTLALCMKFCGMCATPQHWTCGLAECHFDQNLAVFKYCGGCGGPRCESQQPKKQSQTSLVVDEADSSHDNIDNRDVNEAKENRISLIDSPTAVVSVVDLEYE